MCYRGHCIATGSAGAIVIRFFLLRVVTTPEHLAGNKMAVRDSGTVAKVSRPYRCILVLLRLIN